MRKQIVVALLLGTLAYATEDMSARRTGKLTQTRSGSSVQSKVHAQAKTETVSKEQAYQAFAQMQQEYESFPPQLKGEVRNELRKLVQTTVPNMELAEANSEAAMFKQLSQMGDADFDRAFFSKEMAETSANSQGFFDSVGDLLDTAKNLGGAALDGINNATGGALQSVGSAISDGIDSANNLSAGLINKVAEAAGDVKEQIKNSSMGGTISNVLDTANQIGSLVNSVTSAVPGLSCMVPTIPNLSLSQGRPLDGFTSLGQGSSQFGYASSNDNKPLNETVRNLTMKDMNALYNVYKNADRNGNGIITKDELARAFNLHPADQQNLYNMMSSMDTDSNGVVDFSEFVNWGSQPDTGAGAQGSQQQNFNNGFGGQNQENGFNSQYGNQNSNNQGFGRNSYQGNTSHYGGNTHFGNDSQFGNNSYGLNSFYQNAGNPQNQYGGNNQFASGNQFGNNSFDNSFNSQNGFNAQANPWGQQNESSCPFAANRQQQNGFQQPAFNAGRGPSNQW